MSAVFQAEVMIEKLSTEFLQNGMGYFVDWKHVSNLQNKIMMYLKCTYNSIRGFYIAKLTICLVEVVLCRRKCESRSTHCRFCIIIMQLKCIEACLNAVLKIIKIIINDSDQIFLYVSVILVFALLNLGKSVIRINVFCHLQVWSFIMDQ